MSEKIKLKFSKETINWAKEKIKENDMNYFAQDIFGVSEKSDTKFKIAKLVLSEEEQE